MNDVQKPVKPLLPFTRPSIDEETIAAVAEVLRLNGYNTAMFGKSHETPPWEVSVSGPFDHWPARQGFEKFYGFLGGEKSLFRPYLVDGTTFLGVPRDPNAPPAPPGTPTRVRRVTPAPSPPPAP